MRVKDRASVSMDDSDADRSNDRAIPVNALRVRFERTLRVCGWHKEQPKATSVMKMMTIWMLTISTKYQRLERLI